MDHVRPQLTVHRPWRDHAHTHGWVPWRSRAAGGGGDARRTQGVAAAQLEQAVEGQPRAHGVREQRDGPVARAGRHEQVRQHLPGLLRAVQRDQPRAVDHLRERHQRPGRREPAARRGARASQP